MFSTRPEKGHSGIDFLLNISCPITGEIYLEKALKDIGSTLSERMIMHAIISTSKYGMMVGAGYGMYDLLSRF